MKIKDGTGQERNITEDQEKAEVLSKYFCSVFTQEPEENQGGAQSRECNIKMLNLEITEQDLTKKLEKLKIDKSPGPDQLYPRVLYEVRNVIARPLRTLFNRSLDTGEIPDDWLKADIVALYKKGSRNEVSNYRPVSLTCIICKVLESFIRDHIMEYFAENNLFSNKQYGF